MSQLRKIVQCGEARRLMTHPGVGPGTALATEVFLGDSARFVDAKALASYVWLIPSEYSSGGRQRLGQPAIDAAGCGEQSWGLCCTARHARQSCMLFRHLTQDFTIPDDWWREADMDGFDPPSSSYPSDSETLSGLDG
jgi:hypothetical protein